MQLEGDDESVKVTASDRPDRLHSGPQRWDACEGGCTDPDSYLRAVLDPSERSSLYTRSHVNYQDTAQASDSTMQPSTGIDLCRHTHINVQEVLWGM